MWNWYRVKLLKTSESHEIWVAPGITRFIFVGTLLTLPPPPPQPTQNYGRLVGAAPGSSQFSSEASTVSKGMVALLQDSVAYVGLSRLNE
ncbi:unnamed protein product [Sphagnum compactum]